MNNLIQYNPDVLTCLANLSNDEVFTSPSIANKILDTLPDNLWKNSKLKFLDPVSKSGVFLREISKRLMIGLENEIPDIQTRLNHILMNQVYGIATTELTSLISRRTVYCSKTANGKYSISNVFNEEDGNITYKKSQHTWKNGSCIYCGASEAVLKRGDDFETYAYSFIHNDNEGIDNMKFDVIVGNPPYQLNVGVEKKNYAVMIFQKFVQAAIKLNPRYVTMIIPSRWFTGGRGLEEFREQMLNDKRLKVIVDYVDSRQCFDGVDVAGGAMYFLWDKHYDGICNYTYVNGDIVETEQRNLSKRKVFNRSPKADKIIDKIEAKTDSFLSNKVSAQTPFGFISNFWDKNNGSSDDVSVITSSGETFTNIKNVKSNKDIVSKFKVIITKATSEHAGQSSRDGRYKVLAKIDILKPNQVCSQTYLVVDSFDNIEDAKLCQNYLKNKFPRFLLLQAISSQDISREKFCFVPDEIYKSNKTDIELYSYFDLNKEEIEIIESSIKEIE